MGNTRHKNKDIYACALFYAVSNFHIRTRKAESTPRSHTLHRATAEAVTRPFLTAEAQVRSTGSPCEICRGQRCTGTVFSPSPSVFPANIPPSLHIYSSGGCKIASWWPQFTETQSGTIVTIKIIHKIG